MNTNRAEFLYRPLTTESAEQVSALQEEFAAIDSFQPVEPPHLHILGGNRILFLSNGQRSAILRKAPGSTVRPIELRVEHGTVEPRKEHIGTHAVRLFLDDPDGLYDKEHTQFRAVADRLAERHVVYAVTPHLTIGYLDSMDALDQLQDTVQALNGEMLHFDAMQPRSPMLKAPQPQPESFTQTEQPIVEAAARIHRPAAIPSGLLAAMQRNNQAK